MEGESHYLAGGYRASLFHLGVTRRLHEPGCWPAARARDLERAFRKPIGAPKTPDVLSLAEAIAARDAGTPLNFGVPRRFG